MSWIKTIGYEDANPGLKKVYDRVKGPDNNIDNVLSIHSLRPHTLTGHMALYKNVLHNSANKLPKWYLEALGVYVSYLNQCFYCVEHHFAGLTRLLEDEDKANQFLKAVKTNQLENFFDDKYLQGAKYSQKLTLDLPNIVKKDVVKLQEIGFSDGEILEINQVTSYFNYVNRSVIGLGVTTDGDILGLSPNHSGNSENWSHS